MYWGLYLFCTGAFLYLVELLDGFEANAFSNMVWRHAPTAFALVVLAPVFFWDLCKLTNRFAGPMVRLRRAMRELAEGGDVEPIRFRKGDFWQDFAEDFNRAAQRVREAEARQGEPEADGVEWETNEREPECVS